MKTKKFTYEDDNLQIEVTVVEATVILGMKRMRLQTEGEQFGKLEEEQARPDFFDRQLLRVYTYPDMVAGTESIVGTWKRDGIEDVTFPWPISFEDFLQLPFPFEAQWEKELYSVNGFWIPTPPNKKKSAETQNDSTSD